MDGHLPVCHRQCALSIAGFIGAEHTAVRFKCRTVNTVRQDLSRPVSAIRINGRFISCPFC